MISRTSSTPVFDGSVHLDYIDMAALPRSPRQGSQTGRRGQWSVSALTVWSDAVECFGDETGRGCLADPTYPGHQERMGQATALDGIAQRGAPWRLVRSARRSVWGRYLRARTRYGWDGAGADTAGAGDAGVLTGWRRRCWLWSVAKHRRLARHFEFVMPRDLQSLPDMKLRSNMTGESHHRLDR